jgi:hypothetical protein
MEKIFSDAEMNVVRYEGVFAAFGTRTRSERTELQGQKSVTGVYTHLRFDESNTVFLIRNVMVLDAIEAVLAPGQRCSLYVLTKESGAKRWSFVIGADIGDKRIYPLGPVDKVSGL